MGEMKRYIVPVIKRFYQLGKVKKLANSRDEARSIVDNQIEDGDISVESPEVAWYGEPQYEDGSFETDADEVKEDPEWEELGKKLHKSDKECYLDIIDYLKGSIEAAINDLGNLGGNDSAMRQRDNLLRVENMLKPAKQPDPTLGGPDDANHCKDTSKQRPVTARPIPANSSGSSDKRRVKDILMYMLANMCMWAQLHVNDETVWSTGKAQRVDYLACTSFQVACFLAHNTVRGDGGVKWDVIISELVEHPAKTRAQWQMILSDKVEELGGFKLCKDCDCWPDEA